MVGYISARPVSGRVAARNNLRLATALGGSLAVALLAFPHTVAAQNECGAAPVLGSGTVTCSTANNPYTNGVTYTATDDLTIVLQDGVAIDTSGSLNPGILAISGSPAGDITVSGQTNTSITTVPAGASGVIVATNNGALTANLDEINTTGANAVGIFASSSEGAISVSANDISTVGAGADGIQANTNVGDITVDAGTISTVGADALGVSTLSDNGNIAVTSDTITTIGAGAIGIAATTGGLGTVTVDAGDITTSGAAATGIQAINFDGLASVTADSISTIGLNADGINVTSAGNIAMVDVGSITTTGGGADGIVAIGVDGVDVTFDSISTTGANAAGIRVPAGAFFPSVQSTPTAEISGGNITTTGLNSDGIQILTSTGGANLDLTGTIVTSGDNSRGVFVLAPGAVTLTGSGDVRTTGANANAIDVASTNGAVNLTVGDVSTTGISSNAIRAIGGTDGDVAVTINGVVTTTGDADAVFITSGDMATVTVGSAGSVLASNGDSFLLTSVNGTTLNNAGTIAAAPIGFAVLAAGGPVTINNSGTLTSDIQLTAGNDTVNNSGTFVVGQNPDFGAGIDVFANSGTVQVGNGASAVVTPTFTGLETFTNTGLVDLRNGRAGDTLTLPGTFNGSGNSQLGLDVVLNGNTNDRLIIGGAASGQTQVLLAPLPGQAVLNPGNVLIQAGAASNANAFDLAGGFVNNGLVRNEIVYNPTDFSFRLTGAPSDTAFSTLGFADGARNLWLRSADAVSAQLRAQRDALWSYSGGEASPRLWVQLHASKESRATSRNVDTFGQVRTINSGLTQDYGGVQMGLDVGGGAGERGGFAFGVTGGYMASEINLRGADEVSFDTANAGVYGSFSSGNLFANVIGKYDHYWGDVDMASVGYNQSIEGSSYGARGEVGFRFGSDSFFVEPAASISWVNTSFDDFTVFGTQVAFEEDDGLRGRAGARIGGMLPMLGSTSSFYVGANYVHEFKGDDAVVFSSGGQNLRFTNGRMKDYGEALAGINVGQANGISGFAEGTYTRSFSDDAAGELPLEGYGGRVGMRVRF